MNRTRCLAAVAALVAVVGLVASRPASAQAQPAGAECGGFSQKYPRLKGRALVVGIAPAPANYSATDPNDPANVIGIEPDLLKAAGACLGFTFTYSKLDFAGLIPALQAGRIQLIAAGMYASDERAKQVDFVQYMKAGEASLVQAGNPKSFRSLADVCDATAAEIVGTVENAILDKQSEACKRDGKKPIEALQFQSNDRAYGALAQGRADILLTDAGVASFLAKMMPGKVEVGFAIPSDFVFGFAISKKDAELRDGLAASLAAMHADGSLQRLVGKWGFADSQIVQPSVKTQ